MKFDLKTPCKNCPFRSDATRITFACRERAEEIEEQAYRRGFPCHLSAEYVEEDDFGRGGGYVAGRGTQHCVGYIILQINETGGGFVWPGMGNNEELLERLEQRVDMSAPVFESVEAFLKANESEMDRS